MLPAHQRLERHDAIGLDVDHRLVVHVELLLLERRAQARLDGHALLQLAIHRRVEELEVVAAAILRLIHRRVRLTQQLADSRAIARAKAHADADGRHERAAVDDDGRIQRFIDPARGLVDLLRALHLLQHDDEFIAAHAHHHVLRAHRGPHALRHDLEQLVAGLMAARIVDVLEAVEIQKQHGQHAARGLRGLDGRRQVRSEKQAVRQSRELVVMCQVIEMLLLLEQLRLDLAFEGDVVGA